MVFKELSRIQIQEAEALGGAEDSREYSKVKQVGYADKGGHKARSLSNQPRHAKHWAKTK